MPVTQVAAGLEHAEGASGGRRVETGRLATAGRRGRGDDVHGSVRAVHDTVAVTRAVSAVAALTRASARAGVQVAGTAFPGVVLGVRSSCEAPSAAGDGTRGAALSAVTTVAVAARSPVAQSFCVRSAGKRPSAHW